MEEAYASRTHKLVAKPRGGVQSVRSLRASARRRLRDSNGSGLDGSDAQQSISIPKRVGIEMRQHPFFRLESLISLYHDTCAKLSSKSHLGLRNKRIAN